MVTGGRPPRGDEARDVQIGGLSGEGGEAPALRDEGRVDVDAVGAGRDRSRERGAERGLLDGDGHDRPALRDVRERLVDPPDPRRILLEGDERNAAAIGIRREDGRRPSRPELDDARRPQATVAACNAALYAMFIRQSALRPSAALSARSRSTTARRSRTSSGLDLWLWSQPLRSQSGKLIWSSRCEQSRLT